MTESRQEKKPENMDDDSLSVEEQVEKYSDMLISYNRKPPLSLTNEGDIMGSYLHSHRESILRDELRRKGLYEAVNRRAFEKTCTRKNGELRVCKGCSSPGKMPVCSRCKKVYYCSKECQLKDWPEHRESCKN